MRFGLGGLGLWRVVRARLDLTTERTGAGQTVASFHLNLGNGEGICQRPDIRFVPPLIFETSSTCKFDVEIHGKTMGLDVLPSV